MAFFRMTFFFETIGDAAEFWQFGLQDPATPIMESILFFHNTLMLYLLGVGIFVSWFLFLIIQKFNSKVNPTPELFSHNSVLEIGWTVAPAVVLLFISVPSFALLYSLDELIKPNLTLKIIGHQWFWSYEYENLCRRYTTSCAGLEFPEVLPEKEEPVSSLPEIEVSKGKPFLFGLTRDEFYALDVEHFMFLLKKSSTKLDFAEPSFVEKELEEPSFVEKELAQQLSAEKKLADKEYCDKFEELFYSEMLRAKKMHAEKRK
jgi:heme/copper-type cytochrome/quinol oxidase subunit 2